MRQASQPIPRPPHRSRRWGIALGGAAVVVALLWILVPQEPTHGGRRLSSWLALSTAPATGRPIPQEAISHAVRAMRPDQVWPVLLRMARSHDSALRIRCLAAEKHLGVPILGNLRAAEDTQQMAVEGFTMIGETAAPALDELTRMLDDPALGVIAVRCLAGVGKPAETALRRSLTNADANVRYEAVWGVAAVTADVEQLIERINSGLYDPVVYVRSVTVKMIGERTTAPEKSIPLLMAAVEDRNDIVSGIASRALGRFGTNAAAAIPLLSRAAESPGDDRAVPALRALSILSAPAALPILLRQLADATSSRREHAAWMLGTYESVTPEITSALEKSAIDPDARMADTAAGDLRMLRRPPGTPADPTAMETVK